MQLYTLLLLLALGRPTSVVPDRSDLAPDRTILSPDRTIPSPAVPAPDRNPVPPSAIAPWPASARVSGIARLKATGMGIPYNNNFKLSYDLHIHIDPSGKASVDVSYQGHSSTVKGTLVNDTLIQLSLGQEVPQNFEGDGFSASLKGIIKSGFLTNVNNKLRMLIHVDATGNIVWNGITVPVTGNVETDTRN
jgi:hypothetical protein